MKRRINMEPYLIVFLIGLSWIVFAAIQDLRTREVANWLTFSLIAIGLGFAGLYSASIREAGPILYAIAGGLFYAAMAFAFYYGRVFAGGDAKLLMGIGVILPYNSWSSVFFWSGIFLLVLFSAGAVYSLIYSAFIVYNKRREFKTAFWKELRSSRWLFLFSLILIIILSLQGRHWVLLPGIGIILFVPLLYAYLQALDKSCMRRFVKPGALREGDWLDKEIKIGRRIIRMSVHGLSKKEIEILKKAGRGAWIKEGIPFVPAFLIAYLIMGFSAVFLKPDWALLVSWIT